MVSGIVLAFTVAATLLGLLLQKRLHEDCLSEQSRDIVKVVLAILGTLAALVLGLMVASAKSSLYSKVGELRHTAARAVQLDRVLAEYGPEARGIRDQLQQIA